MLLALKALQSDIYTTKQRRAKAMMKEKMNVTGKDRRALAERIAKITGEPVKYLGAPSFGYQIGSFALSKDGELWSEDEGKGAELVKKLLGMDGGGTGDQGMAKDHLEISLPLTTLTAPQISILRQVIAAKSALIKAAFKTDSTAIRTDDDRLTFPWFPLESDSDSTMAYMLFVTKLCDFVKGLKRANNVSPERPGNEKYAFRCFLLRLGFIGDDYKGARKILLRNLKGSSAFSKQEVKE